MSVGTLNFALPLGAGVFNSALANTFTGTAQQDCYLERLSISADLAGTNAAASGIVTAATVANQSIFTSSAASIPVEMLYPNAQVEQANLLGVALASGSSVSVTVQTDAAGNVTGMVGTAPVPAGVDPSSFSLSQLSMIFPMGDAGVIAAGAANAVILTATCSRACTLQQLIGVSDIPELVMTSLQIAGAEQLAGAGEIAVNAQLGPFATDQLGHFINQRISPGEQVSLTLQNNDPGAAATTFARFGIYCI